MAILKIARMGHPALRLRAAPIDDPADPGIQALIADMYETMLDANGAGLAAPQVHVPLRLVLFRITAERAAREGDEAGEQELTVLLNPVIEPLAADQDERWEGCLSVPGLRGLVPRYTRIRYHGLTPDGQRVERLAEGFQARVVQHECDHLDGILYPQRMTDLSKLVFESEWRHILAEMGPQDERATD